MFKQVLGKTCPGVRWHHDMQRIEDMAIRTTLNQLTYCPVRLAAAGAPDDEEPCTSSIGERKWNSGWSGLSHVILNGFTIGGLFVCLMLYMPWRFYHFT